MVELSGRCTGCGREQCTGRLCIGRSATCRSGTFGGVPAAAAGSKSCQRSPPDGPRSATCRRRRERRFISCGPVAGFHRPRCPAADLLPPLPPGEGWGEGKLPTTLQRPMTSPRHSPTPEHQLNFARDLRANATDAEKRLWRMVRNRRLGGFKFRRQAPMGGYVLDFYCHEGKLVVEADGGQHSEPEQAAKDLAR